MPKMFINPAGQPDNLGDSVLRRPYLNQLRTSHQLHVLITSRDDFASALGLRAEDQIYKSKVRWLAAAARAALQADLSFAVNAGEVVGSAREYVKSGWQPLLAMLARARGGHVELAGVSVRPGSSPRWTHLRLLARLADRPTWRDTETCDAVGRGEVQPDWAILEAGAAPTSDRSFIAVAMRGDRVAPSDAWIKQVQRLADEQAARVVVVVQVRRDRERARELAAALDALLVDWEPDTSHRDQEAIVRAAYRRCSAVVSDRIHALIIGWTEGATPLGSAPAGSLKIARTFRHLTDQPIAPHPGTPDLKRWREILSNADDLHADLGRSRSRLAGLHSQGKSLVAREGA